jgi:hypothetical protein
MRLRGVGVCVGSRWQTATASPRPPKARRRVGSLRSLPGSRPHAEQAGPRRSLPLTKSSDGKKTSLETGRTWETRYDLPL